MVDALAFVPAAPLRAGRVRHGSSTTASRRHTRPAACAADDETLRSAAESAQLAARERARLADHEYRSAVRRRLSARMAHLREDADGEEDVADAAGAGVDGRDLVESLGGARLDASVAGRAAGRATRAPLSGGPDAQAALDGLATGVELFQRGCYGDAYDAFSDAIRVAGARSRLGGQVGLWQAQAIYAMGGREARKNASDMLDSLEKHSDGEVRKAAVELKFILTAPVLPMDPGTFVEIPEFDAPHYEGPRFVLAASGVGRMVNRKPAKPEKYSVCETEVPWTFSVEVMSR
jgi:hypothetical protein